jgi:N-acetylglucosamine kinase-like BadF-type ATPase
MTAEEIVVYIGIDGGGSGSRFSFRFNEGEPRNHKGPSLQCREASSARIAEEIASFIRRKVYVMGFSRPVIRAGIAGCGDRNLAEEVQKELESHFPAARTEVMSDVEATFSACFGQNPEGKALLICGTGSVLAAADHTWKLHLFGGFGPLFAEPGSGRQIGRDFITLISGNLDAGREDSHIREHLQEAGITFRNRNEFLQLVYHDYFHTAKLAPVCIALAAEGHEAASEIINTHISGLAEMVHTAMLRIPLIDTLALHGGLFRQQWFSGRFTESAAGRFPKLKIILAPAHTAEKLSDPEFRRTVSLHT